MSQLTRRGTGLYYIDAATLSLYYSDLTNSAVRQVLSLAGAVEGRQLNSVSLTGDGRALLLLDGHTLCLAGEDGVRELDGVLYPTRGYSAGMLLLLAAASVGVAALAWYLIAGWRRGWAPMAIHWGCLLAALAAAGALGLHFGLALPARQAQALERDRLVVEGVLRVTLAAGCCARAAARSPVGGAGTDRRRLPGYHGDGGEPPGRTSGSWPTARWRRCSPALTGRWLPGPPRTARP